MKLKRSTEKLKGYMKKIVVLFNLFTQKIFTDHVLSGTTQALTIQRLVILPSSWRKQMCKEEL